MGVQLRDLRYSDRGGVGRPGFLIPDSNIADLISSVAVFPSFSVLHLFLRELRRMELTLSLFLINKSSSLEIKSASLSGMTVMPRPEHTVQYVVLAPSILLLLSAT